MKTKKLEKKLTLNKKTIANLYHGQMRNVRGGGLLPSDPGFPCTGTEPGTETCADTCNTCFTFCVTCVSLCVSCADTCGGYTCDVGKFCNHHQTGVC